MTAGGDVDLEPLSTEASKSRGPAQSGVLTPTSNPESPESIRRTRGNSFEALCTLGCVVLVSLLALGCSFSQNWKPEVSNTAMIYDAGHYQETVQMIVAQSLESMHRISPADATVSSIKLSQLPSHLILDGPFLPLLASGLWILLGHVPTAIEWRTFVAIETVCHAVSAVLILLLSMRLVARQSLAVVAAIGWAVYPSAVIGAGSFMTEGPIATLLLFVVYACVRLQEAQTALSPRVTASFVWSVLAGLSGGVLLVSKPALAPAIVGVFGVCCWQLWSGILGRKVSSLQSGVSATSVVTTVANASRLQTRQMWSSVMMAGLSFLIVIGSWAAYCYATTGHAYLGANRVPTFNLVKGTEPTTDGWGTFPQTPVALQYPESIPPGRAFGEIWRQSAGDCLNLYARKPERLWGLPWNDYHYKYFGMPLSMQIWWHRLLLLAGVVGAGAFISAYNRVPPIGRFVGLCALGIVASHAIFIPFETMSRYAFTSMPFVVLLAAISLTSLAGVTRKYGLWAVVCVLFANALLFACSSEMIGWVAQVLGGSQNVHWIVWAAISLLFAAFAWSAYHLIGLSTWSGRDVRGPRPDTSGYYPRALCVFLAVLVALGSVEALAHVMHGDELREWSATLKPGDIATRTLSLPSNFRSTSPKPDWALLLIDGDKSIENASVTVNGHLSDRRPQSLFLFNTERAVMIDGLQLYARLCRQPIEALRQWRAIPVPLEWLSETNKPNVFSIAPSGRDAVTIYGDYLSPHGSVALPSLKYLSGGRSLHEIQSYDMRTTENGTAFAPAGLCQLTKHSKIGVRSGALSVGDAITQGGGSSKQTQSDLSASAGRQFGCYRMYLLFGYRALPDGKPDLSPKVPATSPASTVEPFVVDLPNYHQTSLLAFGNPVKVPPIMSTSEQIGVTLRVNKSELQRCGVSAGQFMLKGVSGETLFLPGTPQSFVPDVSDQSKAMIHVEIASPAFPKGIQCVQINLRSSANPQMSLDMQNMELSFAPLQLPSFQNHSLSLH